jgi:hypothetical protein
MLTKTLKSCLFISLCLYTTGMLSAQNNFVEATIFKNKKDSILGFIDYQEWYINPKTIAFKAKQVQKIQTFSPTDITRFTLKSKMDTYQSAIVDINKNEAFESRKSAVYESIREAMSEFKLTRDTVFLLLLAKGAVNLYTFVDAGNVEHFFIQKDEEPYVELLNLKFNIRKTNTNYVSDFESYKTQLTAALNGCPSFTINVKTLAFNQKTLQQVVHQYNQCMGKDGFVRPIEKSSIAFYGFTGLGFPGAKITDAFLRKSNIWGKIAPTVGGGFELSISHKYQPLKLGAELNLTILNYESEILYPIGGDTVYNAAKLVGINLSPFIKTNFYNKRNPNQSYFFKFGLVGSYYPKASYQKDTRTSWNGSYHLDQKLEKTAFGVFVSGGLNIKKLFVEARYEPDALNLISEPVSAIFKTRRISILLGYKLK